MSTSVCVSVYAKISPEPHARSLPNFCACCLWLWLGSPLAGWRNPKGKRQFWGFLPHWQCILQHSIWDPTYTQTAKPIEMPFGMISGLGPRNSVLRGVTITEGEGTILGENMFPTSLIPLIIAIRTGPCSGTRQLGRRMISRVGLFYYRPRSGGVLPFFLDDIIFSTMGRIAV